MHKKLLHYIASNIRLTEKDIALIEKYFEPVLYPKNRILEEAGKVPQYLYYIVSGYLRLFHYNENGDEVTTHINCPPGFFTAYFNFINQTRADENVECVTDCELLRITKDDLDLLTAESDVMKDFSIRVFQQSITYNENRSKELATLTAEQRYVKLIQNYPDILHNVPVQYIASFLGMKAESLSRIRRKLMNDHK
ncbi:Crp/Fnr family transcriptional regulator [Chitinophaga sancti]|uniref:Crp/Fnr family transcriptional regulator n=1 Tax=Chitinophaga sancti TaxID=1004 RepID=A0A1K1SNZ3_9BACT|nr:Crp/Fnr family transcriptional regulator [Chitinophaga sancti]WQD64396.1 Crp/Fnr family transcriptional regulator [Chitinophaga sancti]WQG89980.1 Crp/Fnr family transcriptional regulator [Chitinophaga sancti]SFW86136.1 cAMP-binding domain of CRP or a regulatory subunit of cAMP-dependent protein kinases [Chitinophaga sancti]